GESGDVTLRAPRQVFLLLLGCPEILDRGGHTDRLVGGEERSHVPAVGAEQLHHAVVLDVGETEAPVLLRDLHAESAERSKSVAHGLGVFPGAVTLRGGTLY